MSHSWYMPVKYVAYNCNLEDIIVWAHYMVMLQPSLLDSVLDKSVIDK